MRLVKSGHIGTSPDTKSGPGTKPTEAQMRQTVEIQESVFAMVQIGQIIKQYCIRRPLST